MTTEQPRGLLALEAVAGMLCAGLLVTGVLLALFEIAAPALVPGSGLSATQGPRWDRVLVPLLVGAAGETVRRLRVRLDVRLRRVVAGAVVASCLLALWWGWWR